MTTTINHKIRLELNLTCTEYCFLDYIYQSKKKTFTIKDFYVNLGFDEEDVIGLFRQTKDLLENDGKVIHTSKEWNKNFKRKKPVQDSYRKFKHLSISTEENNKLLNIGYTQKQIDEVYDSIENYAKNNNYVSLFLTAAKWLKKEHPNIIKPSKTEEAPYSQQQLYEAKHYLESDGVVPSWFDKKYLYLIT